MLPGPSPSPPTPLPPPGDVRRLFDWLAPSYDRGVVVFSLGLDPLWKRTLVRRLRPRPGERALDLASGTGLVSERLARPLGWDGVVGVDRNRSMLREGRRARPSVASVRADALHLPFADATFDIVSAGYLFKYVELNDLFREVRRVLKPGGRFGGYDFSAPVGTVAGALYRRYLTAGLPRLAGTTGPHAAEWRALFAFLAKEATGSGWEARASTGLRASGFGSIVVAPSRGGAVTFVWASVPRR